MTIQNKPVVVVFADDYRREIEMAAYLAEVELQWLPLNEYFTASMVAAAQSAKADVAIVRGSFGNFIGKRQCHLGDLLIEELIKAGIPTIDVTYAGWMHTTAPHPIAQLTNRRESIVRLCDFILQRGKVPDSFREPAAKS